MGNKVPYREDVTPGELPHAMRGYNAMGYPPAGYTQGANGMVTIIIMAPPQAQIPDWRKGAFGQQHKGASPRGEGFPPILYLAGAVVVLALVGYLAYAFMGGRAAFPATVPANYRSLWGNIIDGIGAALGIGLLVLSALMLRWVAPQIAAIFGKGGER